MTVLDIVRDYLKANGYDGLYCDETYANCACLLDDLGPCESNVMDCKPGYKQACDCGEGCGFHVGPKPAQEE